MLKMAAKQPLVVTLVSESIARLVGSEALRDRKSLTGAILMARQMVIEMERKGLASKNDVEKCFELIRLMEREQ